MNVLPVKQRHGFCNKTSSFPQSEIDMQMENLRQRMSASGIIETEQVWTYFFLASLFILFSTLETSEEPLIFKAVLFLFLNTRYAILTSHAKVG